MGKLESKMPESESPEEHNAAAGFQTFHQDADQKASMLSKMEARTEERDRKRAEQDEHRDPNEDAFKIHSQFKAAVTELQQSLTAAGEAKRLGLRLRSSRRCFQKFNHRSAHCPAIPPKSLFIYLRTIRDKCRSRSRSCSKQCQTPGSCVCRRQSFPLKANERRKRTKKPNQRPL